MSRRLVNISESDIAADAERRIAEADRVLAAPDLSDGERKQAKELSNVFLLQYSYLLRNLMAVGAGHDKAARVLQVALASVLAGLTAEVP